MPVHTGQYLAMPHGSGNEGTMTTECRTDAASYHIDQDDAPTSEALMERIEETAHREIDTADYRFAQWIADGYLTPADIALFIKQVIAADHTNMTPAAVESRIPMWAFVSATRHAYAEYIEVNREWEE